MNKPSKEDAKWLIGIAVSVLGSAGVFAAMRDRISEMITAGGWAFWVYSAILLAIGVLIGFALGRNSLKSQLAKANGRQDEIELPPDVLRRLELLPDGAERILEVIGEMDVQALSLVHRMHEDSFVDADLQWLNLVDAPGHIRQIAHRSSDQPNSTDEYGRKLYRYRLNADTRKVLDLLPEVFNRLYEWQALIRKASEYEPYVD